MRVVGLEGRIRVVHVHEDVAAGLAFGEEAGFGIDRIGAGAAAGDDLRREVCRGETLAERDERQGAALLLRTAGGEIMLALEGAVVALDAGIDGTLGLGDVACERHRILYRDEAGAPAADLEIHQHAERLSGRLRGGGEAVHHGRVVDGDEQSVGACVELGRGGQSWARSRPGRRAERPGCRHRP